MAGNASVLAPWVSYINAAAQNHHVPAWLIGAIILHESSGVPGVVNPSSGASGLMQVLPSAHPQYDYTRMRGTSAGDIAYQIDSGAAVLQAHIAGTAGNIPQGVQNYGGGSAYRGSYYNDLLTNKAAVDAVLGGSGTATDTGATGGTSGTASTGGFSQSLVDITQFFQRLMQPETWTRAALIVGGVLVLLFGAAMAVKDTRAGKAIAGTAEKAALAAA